MSLPRYAVLKSVYNGKFLRYIKEDGPVHGYLQFSGEEVVSPYVKFEVERAKIGGGLLNIRCCYNNKYWVTDDSKYWVTASSDEPVEDQSNKLCTLFRASPVDPDSNSFRLTYVRTGHNACLWRTAEPYYACLYARYSVPDKDACDVFKVIDWESLLILPKHVAFKGDNGKYLGARWIEGHQYLQFSANDVGDPTVGNTVFTLSDGTIRIKSDYFNHFWRRSPNWIWADTDDSSSDNPDTLFWPVKVGHNVVALRNRGNNYYCKSLTAEGKVRCLNAGVSTISLEAQLEVVELVISRSIYNVVFHLKDGRIYDQNAIILASGVAANHTDEEHKTVVKLTYTESKSSTWNSSVSLKLGVSTTFSTGVPFIVDGEIKISAEFTGSYAWGDTKTTTTTLETTYNATVPPRSKVTVNLIATKGYCDVPFSYTQRDTLYSGEQVTRDMDDGVYTGVNSFNFQYETHREPLDL